MLYFQCFCASPGTAGLFWCAVLAGEAQLCVAIVGSDLKSFYANFQVIFLHL